MSLCVFSFFQDGLKAVEAMKPSVEKLATDLTAVRSSAKMCPSLMLADVPLTYLLLCGVQIKQSQDGERKQLIQLRDILKASLQSEQREVRKRSLLYHQEK